VPNTKTAKKQLRVSEGNRQRNQHYKTVLKGALKRVRTVIETGEDRKAATQALNEAVSTLHHSASKGIIKRQNASRRVGRIARAFNSRFSQKTKAQSEE